MTEEAARAATRKQRFDELTTDYDEKALTKAVGFAEHRFISIERDKLTSDRYAKGHKSLRGACNYLARAVEEGEAYVPELIFDLDNDVKHELAMIVHVAPKSIDAVSLLVARPVAEAMLAAVKASSADISRQAEQQLQTAIDRRN